MIAADYVASGDQFYTDNHRSTSASFPHDQGSHPCHTVSASALMAHCRQRRVPEADPSTGQEGKAVMCEAKTNCTGTPA